MTTLIAVVIILTLACLVGIAALLRRSRLDLNPLHERFNALDTGREQTLTSLREEATRARSEAADASRQLRSEVNDGLQSVQRSALTLLQELGRQQHDNLDRIAGQLQSATQASMENGRTLRDEIARSLGQVGEQTATQVRIATDAQRSALEVFAGQMTSQAKQDAEAQRLGLDSFGARLDGLATTLESRINTLLDGTAKALIQIRDEGRSSSASVRSDLTLALKTYQDTVQKQLSDNATAARSQLNLVADNTEKRLEALRGTIDQRLQSMQEDNTRKIEQMRQTVDEKLQGTLEKRLGDSFRLVSERLELVHKGLGDMQSLAAGVGDLKKVLTNVKTRGTWGEVQLGALLEQMLNRDQFRQNVATRPDSGERVEYAIRLPGRGTDSDQPVWLPIDSKCPVEDYQRLVDAAERGDAEGVRDSSRQFELRIKACARDIQQKYIAPPHTTDFGILFVPTEGLYAEVLRTPGLSEFLQRECRVMVAGPTTLAALLSSLQMGFRTLAIEKRSSEVWSILSAVKTEFGKFGDVVDKVKKQLGAAASTLEHASTRTRVMERKLREVSELPSTDAADLLGLPEGMAVAELDAED